MKAIDVAIVAAGAGVLGWAIENSLSKEARYSAVFKGRRVPFLPVYAAGGALVALTAPHVASWPVAGRFAFYAASLTALEAAAGHVERAQGRTSWDYDGNVVDLPHAVAWGVLGLASESIMLSLDR